MLAVTCTLSYWCYYDDKEQEKEDVSNTNIAHLRSEMRLNFQKLLQVHCSRKLLS